MIYATYVTESENKTKEAWQNTEYVLRLYSKKVSTARRRYREFVKNVVSQGKRPERVGGGLIRSLGGWSAVRALRKAGAYMKGDHKKLKLLKGIRYANLKNTYTDTYGPLNNSPIPLPFLKKFHS